MYDIGKILKRSWEILWKYKVLWVFGLLLVLTGAAHSGGGGGGGGNSSWKYSGNNLEQNYQHSNPFQNFNGFMANPDRPQWVNDMLAWAQQNVVPLFATPEKAIQTVIWAVVILIAFCIVIGLLVALVRYPAETAVIRMTDEYEQTGTKLKFKEGWRMGWNHRAFRIWLVDLVLGMPGFLVFAGLLTMGISIALRYKSMTEAAWAGFAGGILLLVLVLLLFGLLMIFVGILREFIVRAVALEDARFGEGFAKGWKMFTRYFGKVLLTWLIMVGFGIAFGFAMMIAFFILIPTYAVMSIPGVVVAAIPGGIAYSIASIFTQGWMVWVIAAMAALPFLLMVVFLPLSFVNGWFTIFSVNVWTLAYRQLKFMSGIPEMPVPVPPAVVPPTNS